MWFPISNLLINYCSLFLLPSPTNYAWNPINQKHFVLSSPLCVYIGEGGGGPTRRRTARGPLAGSFRLFPALNYSLGDSLKRKQFVPSPSTPPPPSFRRRSPPFLIKIFWFFLKVPAFPLTLILKSYYFVEIKWLGQSKKRGKETSPLRLETQLVNNNNLMLDRIWSFYPKGFVIF